MVTTRLSLCNILYGKSISNGLYETPFFGRSFSSVFHDIIRERLNDRYSKDASVLRSELNEPPVGVGKWRWHILHKWRVLQSHHPQPKPLSETFNRTVVVMELSSKGGQMELPFLTEAVSFLVDEFRARAFGVAKVNGQPLPLEVILLVSVRQSESNGMIQHASSSNQCVSFSHQAAP